MKTNLRTLLQFDGILNFQLPLRKLNIHISLKFHAVFAPPCFQNICFFGNEQKVACTLVSKKRRIAFYLGILIIESVNHGVGRLFK